MTDTTAPQLIAKLNAYLDQANKWQERRHEQWKESYELYRDNVVNNRLIQRQSVNIPLMKMTIRTLMAKFKKRVDVVLESLSGDKQKDVYINEYWLDFIKKAKIKLKDIAHRKQVMLYGRSFWKLLVAEARPNAEVLDPQDVRIDRFADPADLDGTANDIIHLHIYRTLKELENNPEYDKEVIKSLSSQYSTTEGMKKSDENRQSAMAKNERMTDMGVPDMEDPSIGETIVELNEHYVKLWDKEQKRFRFHLVTKCDEQILRNKPLAEVFNNPYFDTHTPFVSLVDDLERTDTWSDGIADIIRTINKVLNVWFSQLVENRTLRNFGMNYFDATANPDWNPPTMEPVPGGWYPLPGKPGEVYQRVDISDLSESIDEIQFLITIAEQATAATATNKGTSEKGQITLGEVKMMLVEAEDRINDLQEPYEANQLEFAEKWAEMVNGLADSLSPVTLYKKSYKGNFFAQEVKPSDFKTEQGFAVALKSTADKERDQINAVQKLMAVKAQFPNNLPLKKMTDRKLLELADLNPEEVKEVEAYEDQIRQGQQVNPMNSQPEMQPINPQMNVQPQPVA